MVSPALAQTKTFDQPVLNKSQSPSVMKSVSPDQLSNSRTIMTPQNFLGNLTPTQGKFQGEIKRQPTMMNKQMQQLQTVNPFHKTTVLQQRPVQYQPGQQQQLLTEPVAKWNSQQQSVASTQPQVSQVGLQSQVAQQPRTTTTPATLSR